MSGFNLGAIAGGVTQLIGGHLSDERREERDIWNFNQNANLQREFAQSGIQWRVADAEAAGVHPLYALGQGVTAASPISLSGGGFGMGQALASMGQDATRAAMAGQTELQRRSAELALRQAESKLQTDDLQRQLIQEQINAIRRVPGNTKGLPFGVDESGFVGGNNKGSGGGDGEVVFQGQNPEPPYGYNYQFGGVKVKPREMSSRSWSDHSSTAGVAPHWDSYQVSHNGPGGRPFLIDLPAGTSPSEAWESIGESFLLATLVVQRNIERYGKDWMIWAEQRFPSLFRRIREDQGVSQEQYQQLGPWGRFREAFR